MNDARPAIRAAIQGICPEEEIETQGKDAVCKAL